MRELSAAMTRKVTVLEESAKYVAIPPTYKAWMRKLAKDNRRTVSEELRMAIESHLARSGTITVPEATGRGERLSRTRQASRFG